MGWKYDGDEDDFNEFVRRNEPKEFYDLVSNERYDGIGSVFLDKLILFIASYSWDGQKGLENMYSIHPTGYSQSLAREFISKLNKYLNYDSNGKIHVPSENHFYSEDSRSKFRNLNSIKQQIINIVIPDRDKKMQRLIEYMEHTNVDIIKEQGLFQFDFSSTSFLGKRPCSAIELLALTYANHYTEYEDGKRDYNGHILKDIVKPNIIESVFYRVANKLHLENYLKVQGESVIGEFADGSYFYLEALHRPNYFECIDLFELNDHLNDSWLRYNYLKESFSEADDFYKKIIDSLSEDVFIEIKIPTNTLKSVHSNEQFLEFQFSLKRSPHFQSQEELFKEIEYIKSHNTLESLIQEGTELLNRLNIY